MVTDQDIQCGYSRDLPITQENFPRYKTGANYSDKNRIRDCHKAGYDTFQTAHALAISENVVKSFWPQKRGKPRNNA